MNTEAFANDVTSGNMNTYVNETAIRDFAENASPKEMEAVSQALGIKESDWSELTPQAFSAKMDEFYESGKVEEIKNRNAKRKELLNISEEAAKEKIPSTLSTKEEGATRYKQGKADIGVLKEGDNYILYDYPTQKMSKTLTRAEAESALDEIRQIAKNGTQGEKAGVEEQSKNDYFDSVDEYTEEEIQSILKDSQNKIAKSNDDIIDFITSSFNGDVRGRLFIGKLKSDTSTKIKNDTNISTNGKSVVLTSDEIKHIFNQHGNAQKEALRGHEAITFDNFLSVLEAIFEPDSVSVEKDSNNVVSLIFKRNNNGITTAVTIVSEKKKALTLKSARIIKKKQHISPPSDVQASNPTSNNERSMNTVSNNIISKKETKINPLSKKIFPK